MIAIDTNILVRYFLSEEDAETDCAAQLIETSLTGEKRGFVTAVTVCETIWVLRSQYAVSYATQCAVLSLMLDSPQLDVEHRPAITAAIQSGHADIADAIIRFIGVENGCEKTVTLDRKFARLAGVELLVG